MHVGKLIGWLATENKQIIARPPSGILPVGQHPKLVYGLLLRCVAAATQKLATDACFHGSHARHILALLQPELALCFIIRTFI
jgi:hypothetical protein